MCEPALDTIFFTPERNKKLYLVQLDPFRLIDSGQLVQIGYSGPSLQIHIEQMTHRLYSRHHSHAILCQEIITTIARRALDVLDGI